MRLENQSMSIPKGKIPFGNTPNPLFPSFPVQSQIQPQAQTPPQVVTPQKDVYATAEPKSDKKDMLLTGGVLTAVVLSATGLFYSVKHGKANNELKTAISGEIKTAVSENSEKVIKTLVERLGTVIENLNTAANGLKTALSDTLDKAGETVVNKTTKALEGVQESLNKGFGIIEDMGIKVEGYKPPIKTGNVSIWGDLNLNLPEGRDLEEKTFIKLRDKIDSLVKGEHLKNIQELENPRIVSVSYEGLAGKAGGQCDVAIELPRALKRQKCDVFNIAPCLTGKVAGKDYVLKQVAEKEFLIKNPIVGEIKVTEIIKDEPVEIFRNGKMQTAKMSAYRGFDKDEQEVVYLHTDLFGLGNSSSGNIYSANNAKLPEKERIALFNKLTMKFIEMAHDGKVQIPEVDKLVPMRKVDRLIAHEAWQSGGLFGQMRFLPPIQEHLSEIPKTKAEYFEQLADSSLMLGHNMDDIYQGKSWDKKEIENIMGILYGEFAKPIVENGSYINDFFGKGLQRVGFVENHLNFAHMGAALKGKLVPVSPNYANELIHNDNAAEIKELIDAIHNGGSIKGILNGIDNEAIIPNKNIVDKINHFMNNTLPSDVKDEHGISKPIEFKTSAAHYADVDGKTVENLGEAVKATKESFIDFYKKLIELNKNGKLKSEKIPAPLNKEGGTVIEGHTSPMAGLEIINLDHINLDGVTAKTPVFSMIARFDPQKGFDTCAKAAELLMKHLKEMNENSLEKPLIILTGDGENQTIKAIVEEAIKGLGEDGNRVIFQKGFLDSNLVNWTNMASDFTFMPSNWEPCGIGDAKSLYSYAPVIAAKLGGIPDKVKEKINGLFIKYFKPMTIENYNDLSVAREKVTDNAEKLKDVILQAMDIVQNHPEEHLKMRINAGTSNFSWTKGSVQEYMKELKIKQTKVA